MRFRTLSSYLVLCSLLAIPRCALAGDPVPDVDVVLEQIPGGTVRVDVRRPGVDEIWIEVLPEMVDVDRVELPDGWGIGRSSDVGAGILQLEGEPTGDEGIEVVLHGPDDTIFQTRVSIRQTSERWTPWLDRDDPSGQGDFETLQDFVAAGLECAQPVEIECQSVDGVPYDELGQDYTCDLVSGGVCQNADNRNLPSLRSLAGGTSGCLDYRVRFRCAD